jgi:hypothetical protein
VASSCSFEELVTRLAEMLKAGASEERIDRFMETLSPAYRAEVLTAAQDLLAHDRARQP